MKPLLNIILVCCAGTSLFYLQSCYDPNSDITCGDTETETRNISAADISKVPYTGFDTLYFLNKKGDTCIVRGTGKQYGYETSYDNGDPACPPPRRYLNQLYTIKFVPVKGNLEFELTQKSYPQRIYIDRYSYNVKFDWSSSSIGLPPPPPSAIFYIDSITLNRVLYEKISVFLTEVKGEIGMPDTSYKLFYNRPYGVLRLKSTKQNEEFSIISKP
jgi:hypothetical protein